MARKNKLKPVLWFSRHCPTEDQLKDAQTLGFEIVSVDWGMRVGELELDSDEMVEQMLEWITNNVRPSGAKAIFGLPSIPIMGHFKCVADLTA